ncbi:hypothetical protein ACHWGR_25145, partial [Klebsiella pneumoniae]|uniref:hypothetical protein n=1 Tax=Klebsiella pneumoniae TaxID=573 RepID=UPI00376EBBA9
NTLSMYAAFARVRMARSGSVYPPDAIVHDAKITHFASGQERQEAGASAMQKTDAFEIPV